METFNRVVEKTALFLAAISGTVVSSATLACGIGLIFFPEKAVPVFGNIASAEALGIAWTATGIYSLALVKEFVHSFTHS